MRQVELPPKEGGIVTEVGTRWTLPLMVMILRLPFLGDAYCFLSNCLALVIVSSTFIQWTIVFVSYCSHTVIVLTVVIVSLSLVAQ
jgi:hypothetical protein